MGQMDLDDPEEIIHTSLQFLYDYSPVTYSSSQSLYTYRIQPSLFKGLANGDISKTITLQIPDTQPANWHLHASSLWVASVYIADHIEDLHLDLLSAEKSVRVLELGAGAGLPSILMSRLYSNAIVVSSDYPDDVLIRCLQDNVERNNVSSGCRVVPYAWGSDITPLSSGDDLFDVIIAADTLWNPELHGLFLDSLLKCLKRDSNSCAHLVAGLHTGRYTLQAFMTAVGHSKLEIVCAVEREVGGQIQRAWDLTRAEGEDEKERRRWVVWIIMKWKGY